MINTCIVEEGTDPHVSNTLATHYHVINTCIVEERKGQTHRLAYAHSDIHAHTVMALSADCTLDTYRIFTLGQTHRFVHTLRPIDYSCIPTRTHAHTHTRTHAHTVMGSSAERVCFW